MNTVNRIVIVVLLLVIMASCTIALVFPVRVLDAAAKSLTELADSIRQYGRLSPQWLIRVGVGALFALTLDIIIVLLLVVELRRPKAKFVRVEKAAGGEVLVSVGSIADRLRYEVDALPNVLRARPHVSVRRKGVVVSLEVETAAGLDVPVKAEEIVETARRVVEDDMGLKLARPPKVNLHAVPYPKMAKATTPSRLPPVLLEPEEPSFAKPSPGATIAPIELDDTSAVPPEEDH